ncbi:MULTISPECIES: UDP-N-acetylglucosamine--N-acetylmuramyl-(pentapeptide) pyrophosphoryl-undecaprenol N-acetylglucosamine transferase [unclassified Curtobacterium]|uniref:UDP-N-acetylglucosamine--N-acetylmuramyl- (pentapeptide) pyrophosphoryl-undecaprenol N-acetylglucosamine transferase n=1 Tax=unclassified Curtobacterium TaxID=257496 RepID=UPI000DA99E88|nr:MULTISPECIES: UDP-N-acetylglucosamine--N-acetylmuramyl-(pentapeptide) pyrophosphoryl-undecaprenol N-acetylglucosamine transferase [unclassified Curtobacterium]WIB68621.1 UDP-N-acetylglucosamine--N-acetylmuramyl-(pentapeptide) pyrophosphoryl-undecaprenol N-acetylglucosamine transferase [Curtobacterium sp. MCBD17_035]WIE55808.1 UDP-N-acetylglucosamine--N-acetylmuramyl-(pentapeptide) pyrophosphoryl-undecaprenol N-acetylglucosamine transferase [Curtobacterium sp. MCBD17_003]
MSRFLFAGGGTAGHVNPLLAVADRLRERRPDDDVLVLGTAEGLEARLVPLRGYELATIPRLPFPRRPNAAAVRFPGAFRRTVAHTEALIRDRGIDVVFGVGGYAAAPAYIAARRTGVPLVVHEANARAGLANRLAARFTDHVGTTFSNTRLPHARLVGMPLRREIETLDRRAARAEGLAAFGLDPARPVLLVTGGSSGARRINETVHRAAAAVLGVGWQILHIVGAKSDIGPSSLEGYHVLPYCDRMDLAMAAADFVVSRSGAGMVCELTAVGLPSVLVPYPVGNGEQRLNARDVVEAGGAVLVADEAFLPEWVTFDLLGILQDRARIADMAVRAGSVGHRDGADRMTDLVIDALRGRDAGRTEEP